MRTRDRGTPASSAKNRTHSSFALPSTGGAARSSFHASPNRPVSAVRLARGCTFTVTTRHATFARKIRDPAATRVSTTSKAIASSSQSWLEPSASLRGHGQSVLLRREPALDVEIHLQFVARLQVAQLDLLDRVLVP